MQHFSSMTMTCNNIIFTEIAFPKALIHTSKQTFNHNISAEILLFDKQADQCKADFQRYHNILSEEEHSTLNSFNLKKRKIEFLAGRLCAKQAIISYSQTCDNKSLSPKDISIKNLPSGRPFFTLQEKSNKLPQCDISISHSNTYACAIASHYLCGIDIQYPSKTLLKVKEKYCTVAEELLLTATQPYNELESLSQIWSAKEAVRKAFSNITLLGFLEITLVHIDTSIDNILILTCSLPHKKQLPKCIKIITTVFDDHAIAITSLTKVKDNA